MINNIFIGEKFCNPFSLFFTNIQIEGKLSKKMYKTMLLILTDLHSMNLEVKKMSLLG